MTERQQHDVPVVPGRNTAPPPMTISSPPVRLDLGDYRNASTLWRATRIILAIVALIEVILSLAWALAFGIDVSNRLAELNQPAPDFSECVGEVCD